MTNNKFIVTLTTLLLCIGCNSDDNDQQQELNDNQAKWEALNINNYSLTQSRSCFCPLEIMQPTVLLVQDNQTVLSYSVEEKIIVSKDFRSRFLKVDALFSKVNSLIDNSDSLTVEYHPTYGYPTLISVDIDKQAVDDEYSIKSESFIDSSSTICPAVFTPSFYVSVIDKNSKESLNCNISGSFDFEDKESETFEQGQHVLCELDQPMPLGSDYGIANLTINAEGFQSQQVTNIHVIADHCELKTQNISIELVAE